jgi:nucleotide-binding universal stress UspA family protein
MKDPKLLVPLDRSALSGQTVQALIARKTDFGSALTLLHVLDLEMLESRGFPDKGITEFSQRVRQEALAFLEGQQQLFAAAGINVTTLLKEGNSRETICKLADSGDFDMLVMGRNPGGELRALLLGQVANYVIHRVRCPVLLL